MHFMGRVGEGRSGGGGWLSAGRGMMKDIEGRGRMDDSERKVR